MDSKKQKKLTVGVGVILISDTIVLTIKRTDENINFEKEAMMSMANTGGDQVVSMTFGKELQLKEIEPVKTIFISFNSQNDILSGKFKTLDQLVLVSGQLIDVSSNEEMFAALLPALQNVFNVELVPMFLLVETQVGPTTVDFYTLAMINPLAWNTRVVDHMPHARQVREGETVLNINDAISQLNENIVTSRFNVTPTIFDVDDILKHELPSYEKVILKEILRKASSNAGSEFTISTVENALRHLDLKQVIESGGEFSLGIYKKNKDKEEDKIKLIPHPDDVEKNNDDDKNEENLNVVKKGKKRQNPDMPQLDGNSDTKSNPPRELMKPFVSKIYDEKEKICIVLPVGHGKSYISKKYPKRYIDVDSFYDMNDKKLIDLRRIALKSNEQKDWDTYNDYYYSLLRKSFDAKGFNKPGALKGKIILLHDVHTADVLGLSVIQSITFEKEDVLRKELLKNMKKQFGDNGDYSDKIEGAILNRKGVMSSTKPKDLVLVTSYDEIEELLSQYV